MEKRTNKVNKVTYNIKVEVQQEGLPPAFRVIQVESISLEEAKRFAEKEMIVQAKKMWPEQFPRYSLCVVREIKEFIMTPEEQRASAQAWADGVIQSHKKGLETMKMLEEASKRQGINLDKWVLN